MVRLSGQIEGDLPSTGITYVGVFAGPRMVSEPIAWTSLKGAGFFSLDGVPPGNWYVHAAHCASWEPGIPAFPTPSAWGSAGGPYGYGRPVTAEHSVTDLRLLLHPAWRDLTHLPAPLQPALAEYHQQAVMRAAIFLAASHEVDNWLDALVGEVNLTRSFLAGLFKRATGLSLQEFRTRALLERAKGLLIETDRDVLAVALEVGYSAPQLTRLFNRYIGLSPGDFRRLVRQAQAGRAPSIAVAWPPLSAQLGRAASGTVITGNATYAGRQEGAILYIGAFPQPVPATYPLAWTALPAPGPFTLHVAAGSRDVYVLACYCRRRMRYPGDLASSFAVGAWGPVTCGPGQQAHSTIDLVDSDLAVSFTGGWFHAFLPDGR